MFVGKDQAAVGRKLSAGCTVSRETMYGTKVLHQLCIKVVYEVQVKSAPNCFNSKLVLEPMKHLPCTGFLFRYVLFFCAAGLNLAWGEDVSRISHVSL